MRDAPPFVKDAGGVVQTALFAFHMPQHQRHIVALRLNLRQRRLVADVKIRLFQPVFGRIARERQFRRHQHLRPHRPRFGQRIAQAAQIARNIAHRKIALHQRDFQTILHVYNFLTTANKPIFSTNCRAPLREFAEFLTCLAPPHTIACFATGLPELSFCPFPACLPRLLKTCAPPMR